MAVPAGDDVADWMPDMGTIPPASGKTASCGMGGGTALPVSGLSFAHDSAPFCRPRSHASAPDWNPWPFSQLFTPSNVLPIQSMIPSNMSRTPSATRRNTRTTGSISHANFSYTDRITEVAMFRMALKALRMPPAMRENTPATASNAVRNAPAMPSTAGLMPLFHMFPKRMPTFWNIVLIHSHTPKTTCRKPSDFSHNSWIPFTTKEIPAAIQPMMGME